MIFQDPFVLKEDILSQIRHIVSCLIYQEILTTRKKGIVLDTRGRLDILSTETQKQAAQLQIVGHFCT